METLGPLSETLDTELKGWLNLSEPREAAASCKSLFCYAKQADAAILAQRYAQTGMQ